MSTVPALAWSLWTVPLVTGALLAASGRRLNRVAPILGTSVAMLTLGLAAAAAALRPAGSAPLFAGIVAGVRVDGLSAAMVLTTATVTLAVLAYSMGELDELEARGRFFGLMLMFSGAMLLTVTATTLALLLMGWEAMGAASYALIGYWWHEPRRVAAANTAFLTTRAGDLGLYLAAGAAVGGGIGGLSLAALPRASAPWIDVVTVGVVLAALGKSAQLPFSFWLSRAMEGPSPVSALLHSATMVAAGAYLLLRTQPLLAASGWGGPAVAWIGAITALVMGLVAVAQRDLKQLLAASTCAQIGFMVLAAGTGSIAGGVMHLVAHAAVKSLLFLAAGAWLVAIGTKALDGLQGAARRYPVVGVTFTVGAFALAGIPPASLWASKDELLAGALHDQGALYAVGLAAAVISAIYSARAVWYVWQPASAGSTVRDDTQGHGTRRVTTLVGLPLILLAVGAATLGMLALPPIAEPLRHSLHEASAPVPATWELVLSGVLAVAASAVTWWWGGRTVLVRQPLRGWLARWLDLPRAVQRVVVEPTLRLSRMLADFDDRVLDRAVQASAQAGLALAHAAVRADDRSLDRMVRTIARGAVSLGRSSARVDDTGVDRVVAGVASGARQLGRLARRPQAGKVHQYYAQLVAALVVLAVVFVMVR